jgi:hypothetical protein
MVATAHEEATGTGAKVDFSQLAMFESREPQGDNEVAP